MPRPFDSSVKVKLTNAGPRLLVAGVEVRSWNGCMYNHQAQLLAKQIRQRIDNRLVSLKFVEPSEDPSKESYGYNQPANVANRER
jgi:hypothetical protein